MQIQISWLLQKPTDLDLHCLWRQGLSGFCRTRVNSGVILHILINFIFLLVEFYFIFCNIHWFHKQAMKSWADCADAQADLGLRCLHKCLFLALGIIYNLAYTDIRSVRVAEWFGLPTLGSLGPRFESCWMWNSVHDSVALNCTEPFIFIITHLLDMT